MLDPERDEERTWRVFERLKAESLSLSLSLSLSFADRKGYTSRARDVYRLANATDRAEILAGVTRLQRLAESLTAR